MQILIAEDDPLSRRILQSKLNKWGYDIIVATDGNEAWEILRGPNPPRLAVLDWMMPGIDGVELCRRIRNLRNQDYTYIVLLTAKGRKENIVEGMNSGADDYITKPFDSEELRMRLRAAQRIIDLQEELVGAREAFRDQAIHDSLTGLHNRMAILEMLNQELARGERGDNPVAVYMIDLDHFKNINDTYGHKVGDAVLCEAAFRMRAVMRNYDAIGRYGGEEFVAILADCNPANAVELADRFRRSVAETPIEVAGESIGLTVSIGVVTSDEFAAPDANVLITAADKAMYCAKRAGRNRVELARPSPTQQPI